MLRGRALASHEVAALFHVCSQDQTAAGPRDAVILALGVAAGLRRAEIASLDLADLALGRDDYAMRYLKAYRKRQKR